MTPQDVEKDIRSIFGAVGYLNMEQLAIYLGKSTDALRKMKERGTLPIPIKLLGGRHCVSVIEVGHWLGEQPKTQPASIKAVSSIDVASKQRPSRKITSMKNMLMLIQRNKNALQELECHIEKQIFENLFEKKNKGVIRD